MKREEGSGDGTSSTEPLEKKLEGLDRQIQRIIKLAAQEAISEGEMKAAIDPLHSQKEAILSNLKHTQAIQEAFHVSDDEILEVIKNINEEVKNANQTTRKSVARTLFKEVKISPKQGDPWERDIEIEGFYVPLTRVNVASPTRFELVLPT